MITRYKMISLTYKFRHFTALLLLVFIMCPTVEILAQGSTKKIEFRTHIIDDNLIGGAFSNTGMADMDGDGTLDYIMSSRGTKKIYVYKFHEPGHWSKYIVGENPPTDAGGTVLDVDGDGLPDYVVGAAWYRNSGDLNTPYERIIFDESIVNGGIHDQVVSDVNGDGKMDVITMSDKNNLRWYNIPKNPKNAWEKNDIGTPVHGGVAPKGFGDLDGDGDTDVVRTDVWFENVNGKGTKWKQHDLGPFMPLPEGEPGFAANAARSWVEDINKDGRLDVVQTVEEMRAGRIWWMENLGPDKNGTIQWHRHEIAGADRIMGGLHSLGVADFTGDGIPDVITAEQDWQRARPGANGEENPRYFLYENLGVGPSWSNNPTVEWKEHVIADVNLGGHEVVFGDVTGDGMLDIVGKPWSPSDNNALGGKAFVIFLENKSVLD
ncbi:VCBS repeat-containing protein [Aurantibacter crassamenti]|uniref:FG-GAP repeat domain-containing protein n=1 Tax=Aurantibacter crassamenti TaxID=1837375 RepID=UPI001939659B|nr:VCBS repeat-containing protein [Aurantibacter crassamenti]MBM1105873.1 VCBS repeat-containing protein [Aurantibacter crassamenti]